MLHGKSDKNIYTNIYDEIVRDARWVYPLQKVSWDMECVNDPDPITFAMKYKCTNAILFINLCNILE